MRGVAKGFAVVVLVGGIVAVAPRVAPARQVPCPEVILPAGACPADVGAAVAQCCPCGGPGFKNHGQYVKCVAHATNALRQAGCLDFDQRRSLKRCAARSTCNKPQGFVTCCRSTPGECVDGFCEGTDPPLACLTEAECPVESKCSLKRDAATCEALGGVAGTGSCCNACAAVP